MARLIYAYQNIRRAHAQDLRKRRNQRRMMRYADMAFSMSDDEFVANYRLSKNIFNELFNEIKSFMTPYRRKSEISPRYKTLVALSFFATGSYQRLVGGTYGTLMSQQSVSRAIKDVCDALNSAAIHKKWIKFPQTQEDRNNIKRRYEQDEQTLLQQGDTIEQINARAAAELRRGIIMRSRLVEQLWAARIL